MVANVILPGLLRCSSRAGELVSASSTTDVGSSTWVTWHHLSTHHWTYGSLPTWDCGECAAVVV